MRINVDVERLRPVELPETFPALSEEKLDRNPRI
jgi:hypothetical protein